MNSHLKEQYFLDFNKSNIAKDLVQSEVHLRRLTEGPIKGGHANCVVKHSLHSEGESEEATSHGLIVEGSETSQNFKALGDHIRKFRKKIQANKIDRDEAIREVRALKDEFASFNPEFDMSKCKSCGSVEELMEQVRGKMGNPIMEKVLNTHSNNIRYSDKEMIKNIAVVYGANFAGKLIDQAVKPQIPSDYDLPVTVGLAVGLPLIAKFAKLSSGWATLLTVIGGYESTNLWDIAEQYISPVAVVRRAVSPYTGLSAPVIQPATVGLSKYVVTG